MSVDLFVQASLESLYMVFISGLGAAFFGIPLGVLIFITTKGHILHKPILNRLLSIFINTFRSIPFIILLVAIIPFTRALVGSSIGTTAAIVPLTIAAIPFLARLVEGALAEVPQGLVEAGQTMGANPFQIILKVLLPEALPGLIHSFTVTLVNLIGYSAMAGTVGGGGLGDLAIRFGYQRFNAQVMLITVLILIAMVQCIQSFGDLFGRQFRNLERK